MKRTLAFNLTTRFVRWIWVVTGFFGALSIWFLPNYGVEVSAFIGWLLFSARSIQLERITPFNSVMWNPWNKVVQCHRDGTILNSLTDIERKKRGLPTPWKPAMGDAECRQAPIY